MTRVPLPTRRPAVTCDIEWRGQSLRLSVGFDLQGKPKEVFALGGKEGSDMAHTIADACVIISIALQHGVEPDALRKSLGTVPVWTGAADPIEGSASVIGEILRAVIAVGIVANWPPEGLCDVPASVGGVRS